MQCRVTSDQYRRLRPGDMEAPAHRLRPGEKVNVGTLPSDWEGWLMPLSKSDMPSDASIDWVPEPGTEPTLDLVELEDDAPRQKKPDPMVADHDDLIRRAAYALDKGKRKGWTPEGWPAVKHVAAWVEDQTGEDASWVTADVIQAVGPDSHREG